MKKQLFLTFAYLFLFSILGKSQGLEWSFNLKSNYSIIDLDQSISSFDANTFSNSSSSIFKNGKGNLGLGFGLQTNYKIYKGFSFISGIEGTFMNFESGTINSNTVENYSLIDLNTQGTLSANVSSNHLGNLTAGRFDPNTTYLDSEWNQSLVYLKMPLNFGYTIKSEKMMVYGGLWYARLIQSDYEGHETYLFRSNRFFNKNQYGANAGLEIQLKKRVNAVIDVTQNFTDVYSVGYLRGGNSVFDKVSGVPTSKRAKLISLGLNFWMK